MSDYREGEGHYPKQAPQPLFYASGDRTMAVRPAGSGGW